jgi:hypothetical protein
MKARSRLATVVVAAATVSGLALAPGIAAAAAPPPLPPGGIFVCLGGIPNQNGCPTQPPAPLTPGQIQQQQGQQSADNTPPVSSNNLGPLEPPTDLPGIADLIGKLGSCEAQLNSGDVTAPEPSAIPQDCKDYIEKGIGVILKFITPDPAGG